MEKRLLIITNNSGGLYQFRKELLEEMISKKWEVYAITPRDDFFDEIKELGVNVIETAIDRRGKNPLREITLLLSYNKIIKTIKPDQIVTYTIKPNLYGGIIARIRKIPYAINITGLGTAFQKEGLLKTLIIKCYKVACKKANAVFFENAGNAKIFLDNGIVKKDQMCVLNGAGVNLNKFYYSEYPQNEEELHFLFIGRIMEEKGVEELFDAVEQLGNENRRIVLDVLGYLEEGYEKRMQELTDKGILLYHGHQDDVRPYIQKSHCFVLPSYHEGMANTNLECAAMGRPVITSRIHGCMEAVVEGKSGFLCEKQDVNSLYKEMKKFIELSYEEKKAMGLAGRKHMEEVFDKKKVVEETRKKLLKAS